jgi:hypothetical protein
MRTDHPDRSPKDVEQEQLIMRIARRALLVTMGGLLGSAVLAQTPPPARVRGTIDQADAGTLRVTVRSGDKVTVLMRPDTAITVIAPAKITDIEPGSYIGTAAMPLPDGSLQAIEIQVFPPSMRGVGEGHRPYDLQPQSTMTNGTVGAVIGTEGRTLTLSYKGGEKKVLVPADAPIITYEPGTPAMLVPGAHVIITTAKAADGTLSADRVGVGKGGLTPPM